MSVTSRADASAAGSSLAIFLKTPAWASGTGPDADVVLASRARLARNLLAYPFPSRASDADLRRVAQDVRRAAAADRTTELYAIAVAPLSRRDLYDLVDARRISPELAEGGANRWALLDEQGLLSVFINEEDHVRIQAMASGNDVGEVLRAAEEAEARLARRLAWAHDLRWGYLTTSLSNMGTGLRLSVLAHLPALSLVGRLSETLRAAHHLGISIRGVHGEHSTAAGDLYQVSNAVTYGLASQHVAGRIRPVADYLIAAERAARAEIADGRADEVARSAADAWRRIEESDRLTAEEALDLLSPIRLCAAAGIVVPDGPAPDAALFAHLVAELRTGEEAAPTPRGGVSVQDAIQRPAKIRTLLRRSSRRR